MCGRRQGGAREEKGQGWLVEKRCPRWLYGLPILGQGKESVAQTWERLSVTVGEGYRAFSYFVPQKRTDKTSNHLTQVLGDIYCNREEVLSSKCAGNTSHSWQAPAALSPGL